MSTLTGRLSEKFSISQGDARSLKTVNKDVRDSLLASFLNGKVADRRSIYRADKFSNIRYIMTY